MGDEVVSAGLSPFPFIAAIHVHLLFCVFHSVLTFRVTNQTDLLNSADLFVLFDALNLRVFFALVNPLLRIIAFILHLLRELKFIEVNLIICS